MDFRVNLSRSYFHRRVQRAEINGPCCARMIPSEWLWGNRGMDERKILKGEFFIFMRFIAAALLAIFISFRL